MLPVVILAVVFYRDCIGQFVIGQKLPVAVKDIPAGSLYFLGFLNLQLIIIQIFLSLYDLQIEYSLNQNRGHSAEHQYDYDNSGLRDFLDTGFEPFP